MHNYSCYPACLSLFFFFFFNDTATTEIYTLSLHDALPISAPLDAAVRTRYPPRGRAGGEAAGPPLRNHEGAPQRLGRGDQQDPRRRDGDRGSGGGVLRRDQEPQAARAPGEARAELHRADRNRGEGPAGGTDVCRDRPPAVALPDESSRADRGGGWARRGQRLEEDHRPRRGRRRGVQVREGQGARHPDHRRGGTLAPRTRQTLSWRPRCAPPPTPPRPKPSRSAAPPCGSSTTACSAMRPTSPSPSCRRSVSPPAQASFRRSASGSPRRQASRTPMTSTPAG